MVLAFVTPVNPASKYLREIAADSVRFSHAPMKNESQKIEFMADNEEFLLEVLQRRKETKLGDSFLHYLNNKTRTSNQFSKRTPPPRLTLPRLL